MDMNSKQWFIECLAGALLLIGAVTICVVGFVIGAGVVWAVIHIVAWIK